MGTFSGVLLHPIIPLDDMQIIVSRENALGRQIVHPVQDRSVKQCFLGVTLCHHN